MRNSHDFSIFSRWGGLGIVLNGAFSPLMGAKLSIPQVSTNAYDMAANPAYSDGTGGGNNILKIV
jgi:hypothetical protein